MTRFGGPDPWPAAGAAGRTGTSRSPSRSARSVTVSADPNAERGRRPPAAVADGLIRGPPWWKSLVVTSVRPSRGRAFLQGCAQLHTTADDDSSTSASARSPSPVVGAHPRRSARPRGARRRGVPRRPPAGRLPGRRPLLHGLGLPHHPAHPRRPQPPPIPPRLVLGPSGPSAAARAVAAAGRPDPLLALAGRAQLRGEPAPIGGGHGHLHRQLVAALRPGLLLAGLRDAGAAQPHLEPGHRGAVLRDLADHRPDRVEGRQATGPRAPRPVGRRHHRVDRRAVAALQARDRRGTRLPRHRHPGGLDPRRLRGRDRTLDPQPPRQTRGLALAPPAGAGRPRRHRRRVVRRSARRVALPRRVPAPGHRRRADPGQQRRADAQPAQPRPRVGAARAHRTGQLRHLPVALARVLAARAAAAARARAGSSS